MFLIFSLKSLLASRVGTSGFFYVQDSIIPAKYSHLLSDKNKLDSKSFKDKLSPNVEENPMFQRLGRYPTSVRVFLDPILFLAGLKSSWEHDQQRPAILKWLLGTLSILKMIRI
ncbi:hypothetical protein Tco_0118700 [Tanacetum coccineum]